MEALILVAETGGPTMFARIGVLCGYLTPTWRGCSMHRASRIIGGKRKLARDR
jgi:hypothetical protein